MAGGEFANPLFFYHCFSTFNHNLGFCYNDSRVIKWVLKQASHRFQGVTGSFD